MIVVVGVVVANHAVCVHHFKQIIFSHFDSLLSAQQRWIQEMAKYKKEKKKCGASWVKIDWLIIYYYYYYDDVCYLD